MAKQNAATAVPPIYGRVRDILEAARDNIARTVNTTQVIANWLVGREIVEEEQQGKKRAGYGAELLADLAARLKTEFGVGYGVDNLELFRRFYLAYPCLLPAQKSDAVRRKSHRGAGASGNSDAARRNFDVLPISFQGQLRGPKTPIAAGELNPSLSWTHYRRLLRVTRREARDFYEIEAIRNAWSARELERQINSLLFDRLAKSRDKSGLLRLAVQGQEIAQPVDVLKDPLVLEFLDLPESPRLVESKLEHALIGNLQTFLLELGKGFAFVSRQERITLDGDHFYIDLVFYHTVLKCFVLIDLKVGKPPPPFQSTALVIPPGSSPSMTFFRRGMMCVWQCSPSSTMIQRRPILCATAPVVPEPAKESRTRSLGLVATSRTRRIRRSGFGVSKTFSELKARTSNLASWLCPTSSLDQNVAGGRVGLSSRYCFT